MKKYLKWELQGMSKEELVGVILELQNQTRKTKIVYEKTNSEPWYDNGQPYPDQTSEWL